MSGACSTATPAGVVDLERLGPRERQVQPVGEALGERPAAEREHPRALDAALADQRDVRRPAADVDEQRPGLADLVAAEDPRDRVRLGDDLEQLEVELRCHALQRAEVDQRRERVEDPDLDVAALEADRVGQRVAVDRGAGHRGVDEPDVDVRQPGLPGDRPLGLVERLALDDVDELLELGLGDRLVGLLALLAVGRGEALDQLAGDADDDLGRAEAGHLLGFLERDRAVVDDRRDVGDGARLHVRQALALAPDAADRAVAARVDVEDERLGELGPDVERRAGGERLARRRAARSGARRPSGPGLEAGADRGQRIGQALAPRAAALGHLRAAAAAALERRHRGGDQVAGRDPARDEVVGDGHEQLRLVGIERRARRRRSRARR